jgi:hypothetical protein
MNRCRACTALAKERHGTGEPGQLAHTWEHVGKTKRRAAVNQRPVIPRSMRSGSPSISLLDLGDDLVSIRRVVGPPPLFQPAQR